MTYTFEVKVEVHQDKSGKAIIRQMKGKFTRRAANGMNSSIASGGVRALAAAGELRVDATGLYFIPSSVDFVGLAAERVLEEGIAS